jgi:hypothetical protein
MHLQHPLRGARPRVLLGAGARGQTAVIPRARHHTGKGSGE